MIKTITALTFIGLLNVTTAFAADPAKTDAAKSPPPAASSTTADSSSCTKDGLDALIAQASALTDKEKQRMAMGHIQLAQASLNQKDLDTCAMHMKEASANLNNSMTK